MAEKVKNSCNLDIIWGLGSISSKNPGHNLDTDKVLLLNF